MECVNITQFKYANSTVIKFYVFTEILFYDLLWLFYYWNDCCQLN